MIYVVGAGNYRELFLSYGRKELHDKSLDKLEQLLSGSFEQVHKSYLLKISEIKEVTVESGSKYAAEPKDGTHIPIGRTEYKDIKAK